MITTAFLQVIGGILTAFFSIMPSWGVDTSQQDSISGVTTTFASLNGWVPEQMAFLVLLSIIAVRLFFLAWTGVLFLYRLIPFNG